MHQMCQWFLRLFVKKHGDIFGTHFINKKIKFVNISQKHTISMRICVEIQKTLLKNTK